MRIQNKAKTNAAGRMLQIGAAAFVLFAPTALSFFCKSWGLYAIFALLSLFLGLRLIKGGTLHIGVNAVLVLFLGLISFFVISSAQNMYRHIRLIFLIFSALETMLLAADYFVMEDGKSLEVRMNSMIIASAQILALWNIIYWIFFEKFSLLRPFSAGIGQSDLLGIFMFGALWCCIKKYYSEKRKDAKLLLMCLPMLFSLIMSRSALTWFFGSWFVALYLFRKKNKAAGTVFAVAGLGSGIYMICSKVFSKNNALFDGIVSAFRHPKGFGGGGFVSIQSTLQSIYYPRVEYIGSGGELSCALGICGLICIIFLLAYQLYLTVKHRSWFNAFGTLFCIYSFFAPMSQSAAGLLLLSCICVYGEWKNSRIYELKVKKAVSAALCAVLAAAAVYGCIPAVGDIFRTVGETEFLKNEALAAQRLSSAANINRFDGESCYKAANILRHLYEESGGKEHAVTAEYEIKRAVEREKNNALYYSEYARLLMDTGRYGAALQQCETAVELAAKNDDYKVMLSDILLKLIQDSEKGGADAQRYYKRILECGETVTDIEKKKTVNDIADKAQPYTRIDFFASEEESE